MAEQITFPLSTPQVQAAERVQNQLHHSSANLQHSIAGELERTRGARSETVNETAESENPNIDQEGHLGAEYEARRRGKKAASEEKSPPPAPAEEDDYQGRFINVVV